MLGGAKRPGDLPGGLQFGTVPLAVVEGQAVAREALGAGDGEAGGGIEATGKEDDSGLNGPEIYPNLAVDRRSTRMFPDRNPIPRPALPALGVAPQQLVQLQLETNVEAVRENPVGERRRVDQSG